MSAQDVAGISVPKSSGAFAAKGETFQPNLHTSTENLTVLIPYPHHRLHRIESTRRGDGGRNPLAVLTRPTGTGGSSFDTSADPLFPAESPQRCLADHQLDRASPRLPKLSNQRHASGGTSGRPA